MLPLWLARLGWLGFVFFFLAICSFAADRDSDRELTDRLIAEALKPSPLETNLRRLSDEIGGRIPGTPAFQRAVDWGVAAFNDAGADSVHTEEFTHSAFVGRGRDGNDSVAVLGSHVSGSRCVRRLGAGSASGERMCPSSM